MRGSNSFGHCFSCGCDNDPVSTVCSHCGAALVAPPGFVGRGSNDSAVIGAMKKGGAAL